MAGGPGPCARPCWRFSVNTPGYRPSLLHLRARAERAPHWPSSAESWSRGPLLVADDQPPDHLGPLVTGVHIAVIVVGSGLGHEVKVSRLPRPADGHEGISV